ncbi:PQQ-binding-like beta-propeller repeat protein [Planctomycetota bacterium]
MKITQGGGGWGASFRIAGAAGAALVSKKDSWGDGPTLEQIYAKYMPAFSGHYHRKPGGDALKFSRQKNFINIGDVRIDAQVWPIINKANEVAEEKEEPRAATELYRRILKNYPDDFVQIAFEGIFVPASLYVQRRILRYPKKELTYYRILFDPAAKEIYERAVKRYSIFDYKELVKMHLATSYGDDALFALGNDAVDKGKYDEGRICYERILLYHGLKDGDRDKINLNRDQVWVRLAICYRHLGREDDYRDAVEKIENKKEKTVARLLQQLEVLKYDEFWVRQREGRRSARYDAMDDRKLSEPMPYELSANRGEWEATLYGRPRSAEPDVMPWATETDLIYKDMNVLYSRSLLTGEMNWVFGPGGSSWDWDRHPGYYSSQAMLVHDGVALAHMFVYGPSLVGVDQYTGRMLWAKGPMAARTEEEWLDRYQAAPAATRGAIVVPVVHDDIRGRSHISSTAELASYETRSGKLLWRTVLSRISPLKITQSRYPRKIRILSTTPVVRDGVVYHVTNAGIVAAVDSRTGDVIWLTRYPQRKDILDNFSSIRNVWRNEPPLVRGNRLYVTPVDCELLLCLDTETGRIVWTAMRNSDSSWNKREHPQLFAHNWFVPGFTSDGLLCLVGSSIVFLNPDTGKLVHQTVAGGGWWVYDVPIQSTAIAKVRKNAIPKGLEPAINGDGDDFWWPPGRVQCPPTLTRDGKVCFSMQYWFWQGPFNSDYVFDLKKREIVTQRRWFDPANFITRWGYYGTLPVTRRPVNEESEGFEPAMRMTFKRWEIPFEVDVTYNRIVVRYDRKKMEAVLAERKDLETVFAKAEIARRKGDVQGSIGLYEECKPLLPSEEEDRRKNINLRLYPLYTELARWGHQLADNAFLEDACKKMGATASNPMQEIRALLAYAEVHEKKGDWMKAVRVLQNASRHYWREPLAVSGFEIEDRTELLETTREGLHRLIEEIPPLYREEGRQILLGEETALVDYFLAVANMASSHVLEARNVMAERIRELLSRAPVDVRKEYEKLATEELKQYESVKVGERLLWCWPESEAAKQKIRELAEKTKAMKPVEQQTQLWKFADLAQACGLGDKLIPRGGEGLTAAPLPSDMTPVSGMKQVQEENKDPDMVRLVLPQKGEVKETAHLLFVGGRKKRAYGNRFTVTCWNMKENKEDWISREILLHGKVVGGEGFEVGFEEVFIHGDLVLMHGQYDVVAIDWRKGQDLDQGGKKEKKWHFRVPLGFEIRSVDMCGDVLVLCGRGSTVAISPKTGEIIWDATEMGEYYAGPFFHKDVTLTVRKSPSEVSFRKVGSGRLLNRLSLPGLTTNRKHPMYAMEGAGQNPAAAEAAETYPVAFAEGHVAVSDGLTYHVVDVEKRRIAWSRGATKLDRSVDSAYRMWIDSGRLLVLKPYYAVLENVVFDLASGDMLWRRREGGKKVDDKLKKYAAQDAAGGKASTGLLLSSMTFLDGTVYGIRYMMGTTGVELVGMDPVSGNEIVSVKEKGYGEPEAYVGPSWSKDCVTVRVQDGNKFEVWQVDVKQKKIVQKLHLEGYGRLGEYGDASIAFQGPYHAIWAFSNRKLTTPAGK